MRKLSGFLICSLILSVSLTIPFQYMASSQIVVIRQDKITRNPDGSLEFKTPGNDKVIVSYDKSPILKLEHWGDEAYMQITANFTDAQPDIYLDKIRIVDSDYEVLIYDLPVSNLFEYGGVEYEIILKNKPSKNYITMPIEAKNLVYYYQPLILLDKDDEYRDVRFAGSYAVYHISKRDNEYKTGKAFHILRPVLIDNLGNKIFADILIEKDTLKITMNQTWLDNAVYPVIVDPTFGYTSIGAIAGTFDPLRINALNSSLTESGTVTKISMYFNLSTTAGALRFAIYDNDAVNDRPNNFLDNSSDIEHPLTAGQWENATMNLFLTSGVYWIAWLTNGTLAGARPSYDVLVNGSVFGGIHAWGAFVDPFTFSSYSNKIYSLFATYTPTPETFYLTSLFHMGIASIDVNGTSTANLTETAINDTELALGVANAESGFSFLYWDNETTTHIHSITITETITANTTVTAFAIPVGGGGVAGVSMLLIAVVGGFAAIVLIVASRKR